LYFFIKQWGCGNIGNGHEKLGWKALKMSRLKIQSQVVIKKERMKVEMKVGILGIPICNG
jgi:hypothetical protein